ncbi:MAG: hypothetical protein OEY48_01125 [Gammaproteobacteria bacterium]|nr:hypothetical protein [Gammaproteobacteria bacterium]MDH5591431.1 hypothetical protein [Gammaproteobacteria bacterium]
MNLLLKPLFIHKQLGHLSPHLKYLLLLMIICLSLISCGDNNEEAQSSGNVKVLTDANVKNVVSALAGDYSLALDDLIYAFNKHKEAGTAFEFITYRNTKWTPNYIQRKNYYHDILENNMAYISKQNIKPLFIKFEELIFIGLDLKHALYNGDEERLERAVKTIEDDKKTINAILKSPKFKIQLQSLYHIPLELTAENETDSKVKTKAGTNTKNRIGD